MHTKILTGVIVNLVMFYCVFICAIDDKDVIHYILICTIDNKDVCHCISISLSVNKDIENDLLGKKSKSVFDFLTYLRETWISFFYEKVLDKIILISKLDNSLSLSAKQNALQQIFLELFFFKDFFTKNSNQTFFNFSWFYVGSTRECSYVRLSTKNTRKYV